VVSNITTRSLSDLFTVVIGRFLYVRAAWSAEGDS
jgi:hypothetical protein